jgi:GTP-binding protein
MFLDEAVVEFASGRGGSGAATFHREKHVPRGGPNGADGGRGGDVVLVADRGKRTLYDFRLTPRVEAENGGHASGNKRGKDGKAVEVRVPVGTIVSDAESGETLADLSFEGAKVVLCKGGRGGFGNLHFTSSVRQAPTFAQKGEPGEAIRAKLELKLLADIGLIGLPNAGKSTLISRISAAKPRIADYPFTTIEPNLGVVDFGGETFTVADMPGLIEGASEGHGLGHQFLKHIERTAELVHVVDVLPMDESDPLENYRTVEAELEKYSPEIYAKPRLIALNKIDLLDGHAVSDLQSLFEKVGKPVFAISAATGQGLEALLYAMAETLKALPAPEARSVRIELGAKRAEEGFEVVSSDGGYRIVGKKVERMVAMTDFGNPEGVRYLHRGLSRMGVLDKLREMGAEEGDTVMVGDYELAFAEDF